ncbi:hypothetical protein L195_g018848 [Trifolium pratense]|uniref:Uncharacterized protein n=1 Tax=Trifolium pratense TaxID=57577 RepID=A0A2K3MXY0_TRIPR|nr:hypothetical protein L195_g018848 [Trifolium pratense]
MYLDMQVFSNDDEDLNIVVNYANPSAVSIAAAKAPPQAKAPTKPPPSQPSVSPLAPSPTSIVKSPKGKVAQLVKLVELRVK